VRVAEEFVSVQASPDTVERYLTDQDLLYQWMSPLFDLELVSGEWMAVGSTYRLYFKTLALLYRVHYTLVHRDRTHLQMELDGMFWHGTERWSWFADGPQTIIQNRLDFELSHPWVEVFVGGVGVILTQLDMRSQLVQLQRLIEGHHPQQQQKREPARPAERAGEG
jgi:hypothetical protein